jgi:hypothetical protein
MDIRRQPEMQIRNVLALAAMIAVPAFTAGAQFTTVVAPPPAQKQAVAVAAAKATPSDTGHRATLREMSAWVDSVAGAPAPAVVTDSAAGEVALSSDTTSAPVAASRENSGTTKFADGARAPNTASPLPLILVAGLGALLVGAWLLATGRKPEPAVVEPRRRAR